MNAPVLMSAGLESLIFIAIIVAIMGIIVLGVILVKKYVKPLGIHKDEISEEQAAKEELDRVLIPIEDENVQKQMEEDMNKNGK